MTAPPDSASSREPADRLRSPDPNPDPDPSSGREQANGVRPRGVPVRVIALVAVLGTTIALCAVALWRGWVQPDTLQDLVANAGPWMKVAYVGAVVVSELLWFPRAWGLLAGGVLFGPLMGSVLSFGADLVGAYVCYVIARGGGRAWVEGLLARRPRAERVVDLLARRRGGPMVAILRVMPIAHYTLVSYAAGIGGVRPLAFMAGTAAGIIPGAILYPLLGDSMLRPKSPVFWASLGLVVVALVVTGFATRRMLKD